MSKQYEVFARRECHEALTRIGSVTAADAAQARQAAKQTHGEDWMEMVAIPKSGISWAIQEVES
jgi:1,2-phenylacetyl-CoA epoxidase PaaB subunit